MVILVTLSSWGGGNMLCEYGTAWTGTVGALYKAEFYSNANHMNTSISIQPLFSSKLLYSSIYLLKKWFLREAAWCNRKVDIV